MQDTIKKFKFRDSGVILNAPPAIENEFVKIGFRTNFDDQAKSTETLVFINNNSEFLDFLQKGLGHIEPDSRLWIAYPKGTSKVKTDVNRDTLWATGEQFGVTAVAAISIDETWSALRFRPIDRVGK